MARTTLAIVAAVTVNMAELRPTHKLKHAATAETTVQQLQQLQTSP